MEDGTEYEFDFSDPFLESRTMELLGERGAVLVENRTHLRRAPKGLVLNSIGDADHRWADRASAFFEDADRESDSERFAIVIAALPNGGQSDMRRVGERAARVLQNHPRDQILLISVEQTEPGERRVIRWLLVSPGDVNGPTVMLGRYPSPKLEQFLARWAREGVQWAQRNGRLTARLFWLIWIDEILRDRLRPRRREWYARFQATYPLPDRDPAENERHVSPEKYIEDTHEFFKHADAEKRIVWYEIKGWLLATFRHNGWMIAEVVEADFEEQIRDPMNGRFSPSFRYRWRLHEL